MADLLRVDRNRLDPGDVYGFFSQLFCFAVGIRKQNYRPYLQISEDLRRRSITSTIRFVSRHLVRLCLPKLFFERNALDQREMSVPFSFLIEPYDHAAAFVLNCDL